MENKTKLFYTAIVVCAYVSLTLFVKSLVDVSFLLFWLHKAVGYLFVFVIYAWLYMFACFFMRHVRNRLEKHVSD